jgi:Ca2+-binding EF-hand superfamily protein
MAAVDPAFRDRLKAIFDEFDDDGGGDIDTEELGKVMEQLGQHCTEAELHVRDPALHGPPTCATKA